MAIFKQIKSRIYLILSILILLLVIILSIQNAGMNESVNAQNQPDRCISCHADEKDMSSSHPNKIFGCYTCHLGNPDASNETDAHNGMVRNPSDLHWVDRTCGKSECHSDLAHSVKNSIMTSNSGLVASTLYQWYEKSTPDDSTLHIDLNIPDTSLATSHLRKLCASCHINKRENDFPGEIGERGGGCNDCHLVKNENIDIHPTLTVEIDIPTCEKCHNRSNRTALTYQGKFESEGYGTPYDGGNASRMELSGGRFYYHITADVHFEAGMSCIDCHIAEDVMGDGKRYEHLEQQVHIKCEDCHEAEFGRPPSDNIVWKIISVNQNLKIPGDSLLARTARGSFYANVNMRSGKPALTRKLDGKELSIPQNKSNNACYLPGHERMGCQSCHSAYTPQCYGCHDIYDPTKKQLDKVSNEETYGHWREGRSYLRYEKPTLGVDNLDRVMPFAPGCQVYLTELNDSLQIKQQKIWLTMAPFDPHSTRKAVPECIDCHSNIKRLGLGEGYLKLGKSGFETEQLYDTQTAGLGHGSLEMMTDEQGRLTQRMSRLTARPFKLSEINNIYRVSLCITCHDSYKDPIYKNFKKSIERYLKESHLPCRKNQ
ncbi:MAG: hypothetical protein AB7T22_14515 [Calditrichaceae bacterium]